MERKSIPENLAPLRSLMKKQSDKIGVHHVLNQFMVCLNGTVEIIVSDGESEKKYILSDMSEGLLVPPGYWCEQNYKNKGAILLVFCDKHYNESDYIRDYKIFKNFKEKRLD